MPSMPTSSVVTPWRTLGSWCGSPSIVSPAWEWRSMNPGQTTRPEASIVADSFEVGHVSTVERDSVALDTDGCVEARTGRSVNYKSVGY